MNRLGIAPKRPATRRKPRAAAGVSLPDLCRAAELPLPVAEYRFAPPRRWRFDWAWPDMLVHPMPGLSCRLALEIDGGAWTQGRHTRGKGFIADMEKLNAAASRGWIVIRYAPDQIERKLMDDLQTILKPRRGLDDGVPLPRIGRYPVIEAT